MQRKDAADEESAGGARNLTKTASEDDVSKINENSSVSRKDCHQENMKNESSDHNGTATTVKSSPRSPAEATSPRSRSVSPFSTQSRNGGRPKNVNTESDPRSPGVSSLKNNAYKGGKEVMEQFEPGVYMTVIVHPDGTKVFKRVKFRSVPHYFMINPNDLIFIFLF